MLRRKYTHTHTHTQTKKRTLVDCRKFPGKTLDPKPLNVIIVLHPCKTQTAAETREYTPEIFDPNVGLIFSRPEKKTKTELKYIF